MRLGGFGEILPQPREPHDARTTPKKDKWGLPTLTIDVALRRERARDAQGHETDAAEMLEAAGFKNVRELRRRLSARAWASTRWARRAWGAIPKTSVLNAYNQVHACTNVFVTDGACMASSACQNPSLTYMALTARAVRPRGRGRQAGRAVMERTPLNRRDLALAAGAIWARSRRLRGRRRPGGASPELDTGGALRPARRATLDVVAELIMPATDTPGAREAGVPKFVDRAVADYCTPAEAQAIRAGLDRMEADARKDIQAGFVACTPDQQTALLTRYDAESRARRVAAPRRQAAARPRPGLPTRRRRRRRQARPSSRCCKELVTAGYFTSRIGATQAVRYDPYPGAYHGCVPLKEIGRPGRRDRILGSSSPCGGGGLRSRSEVGFLGFDGARNVGSRQFHRGQLHLRQPLAATSSHKGTRVGLVAAVLTVAASTATAQVAPGQDVPSRADWCWVTIFNGKRPHRLVPKINHHPAGENWNDTFVVKDGTLRVSYEHYGGKFTDEFAHLIYRPRSPATAGLEYRFLGGSAPGMPAWAIRNSGVMLHGQAPEAMALDQPYPVSVEAQLLGGDARRDAAHRQRLHARDDGLVRRHPDGAAHCRIRPAHLPGRPMGALRGRGPRGRLVRKYVNGAKVMEYGDLWLDPSEYKRFANIDPGDAKVGPATTATSPCRARAAPWSSATSS